MFVVIAMGGGMHHVQYVMEIEGEMDICQMEKICYMCQGKAMVRCPACDGTGEVED